MSHPSRGVDSIGSMAVCNFCAAVMYIAIPTAEAMRSCIIAYVTMCAGRLQLEVVVTAVHSISALSLDPVEALLQLLAHIRRPLPWSQGAPWEALDGLFFASQGVPPKFTWEGSKLTSTGTENLD